MENTDLTAEQITQHITEILEAYVFKPNVHNTWVEIKTMIESYLFGLYGSGNFRGNTPDQCYRVSVGLGKTMTDEDILRKIVRVEVKLAMEHPLEFVVYNFQQELE